MHVALLVHSHGVYRAGLKLLLAYELDMRVVEAADTRAALLHLGQQQIDILILDAELLDTDGLQLIEHIQEYHPDMPILILTATKRQQATIKAQQLEARMIGPDHHREDFISSITKLFILNPDSYENFP